MSFLKSMLRAPVFGALTAFFEGKKKFDRLAKAVSRKLTSTPLTAVGDVADRKGKAKQLRPFNRMDLSIYAFHRCGKCQKCKAKLEAAGLKRERRRIARQRLLSIVPRLPSWWWQSRLSYSAWAESMGRP